MRTLKPKMTTVLLVDRAGWRKYVRLHDPLPEAYYIQVPAFGRDRSIMFLRMPGTNTYKETAI